jgi:hypothetical protein
VEVGDVTVTVTQGDSTDWRIVITNAPPISYFSPNALEEVHKNGWLAQIVHLTPPSEKCLCHIPQCLVGWKVQIIGSDQSFTYIIKHYDWQQHSWIGVWPD